MNENNKKTQRAKSVMNRTKKIKLQYANVKNTIKARNKNDSIKINPSNKYDISGFKFSYQNMENCKKGPKLPFMIDPKEFINLLPKRLVFNKPIKEEKTPKELDFDIYKNLNRKAIVDTFNYLFHHIRMGIFVYIKKNKLQYFIPFQNMNYKNNWESKIKFKNIYFEHGKKYKN